MRMMKRNIGLILSLFAGASFVSAQPQSPASPQPAASPAPAAEASAASGPRIQFATPVHDFGKVKAGDPVKYTYIFTNIGDQVLEVKGVQPSCGCTTAGEWSREVKPGATGNIPVQFNSGNFNGQVFKTITVTSNDKKTPAVVLQLKGEVWKPLEFVPPYTIINIPPDASNVTAVVRVINNMEQPLSISGAECTVKSFSAEVKETKPGKEFQVTISAVAPFNPGSVQGKVILTTSSAESPKLEVPFWANVQPPVQVVPPQVMLPQAPLQQKTTPSVQIMNNSTNTHFAITEPAVNAPGVEVEIKEMIPGKSFTALLTFPQGFSAPPGQQLLFTAKTSNPRYPEIRVPILQTPHFGRPTPASSAPLKIGPGAVSAPTAQAQH